MTTLEEFTKADIDREMCNFMRKVALHGKDVKVNKKKLKEILDNRAMSYTELHDKIVKEYKLDLHYKSFMSLLVNRNSWKLLYAYAIVDVLNIKLSDIFDVVDVNITKKAKEKEEWKEKYQD